MTSKNSMADICNSQSASAKAYLQIKSEMHILSAPRLHNECKYSQLHGLEQSFNFFTTEAIDVAQNRPFWRLMSTLGTTQS